jgi:hypothetical protein
MNAKLLASSVAALAMLALASAAQPALARGHGGHGGHGHSMGGIGWAPRFSSVRQFSRPHHVFVRRFRHHRRFVAVGLYPYYGDGCYWLRRRALYTGSPYWWRRYYACRHGYY